MKRNLFKQFIFSLLFGITIYIFWRGIFFIDPTQEFLPLFNSSKIPKWFMYNLPDGLWLYSLLCLMTLIWQNDQLSRYIIIWTFLVVILSFVLEILQGLHRIPGTFDWGDLTAYLCAFLIWMTNTQIFKFKKLKTVKL